MSVTSVNPGVLAFPFPFAWILDVGNLIDTFEFKHFIFGLEIIAQHVGLGLYDFFEHGTAFHP